MLSHGFLTYFTTFITVVFESTTFYHPKMVKMTTHFGELENFIS